MNCGPHAARRHTEEDDHHYTRSVFFVSERCVCVSVVVDGFLSVRRSVCTRICTRPAVRRQTRHTKHQPAGTDARKEQWPAAHASDSYKFKFCQKCPASVRSKLVINFKCATHASHRVRRSSLAARSVADAGQTTERRVPRKSP